MESTQQNTHPHQDNYASNYMQQRQNSNHFNQFESPQNEYAQPQQTQENNPFMNGNPSYSPPSTTPSTLALEGERLDKIQQKKKRVCCGCFKSRASCCTFYCLFTILLGVAIAVILFFLWPRVPQISISDPFVSPAVAPFALSSTSTGSSFVINLSVDVSVASQNYVSFKIG